MYKELEIKANQELYNNIHPLTILYPPSKEFNNVFKKDMFLKNNKSAFHQVVYYLLQVLDAEKLKVKVPTWPVYEAKFESQFRNEVMKYINDLNSIYVAANIPHITSSHFIAPGGLKFIKVMLKLSQLVLLEHLKRDGAIHHKMLLPVGVPKNNTAITTERLNKLQIATRNINCETEMFVNSFEEKLMKAQCEALRITKELEHFERTFKDFCKEHKKAKDDFNKDYPNFDVANFEERMQHVVTQCQLLHRVKEK